MEYDPPLKVLHIIDSWSEGGVRRVITNISEKLLEDGHQVEVLSYFDTPDTMAGKSGSGGKDSPAGIGFTGMGFRREPPMQTIRRFYEVLNREQPDIIHDHYGGLWSFLFLMVPRWRRRSLYHLHNEFEAVPGSPDQKRVVRDYLFRRYLLPKYGRVVTVSTSLRSRLLKKRPALESRCRVVHNSIDPDRYERVHSTGQNVREAYGIGGRYELLIGNVGRLVYEKGQDTVIEVLGALRGKGINAAALLVGEGDPVFEGRLRKMARQCGIARHCYFAGHVANSADYYRAMDVFLFTSRQEPFGLTLLEAMACRTPIVGVLPEQPGGPEEILSEGHNSLVAVRRDAPYIAGQVLRLHQDVELAARQTRVRSKSTSGPRQRRKQTTTSMRRLATVSRPGRS